MHTKPWSAIFYKEIFIHIKEKDFSDIYCQDNGRLNVPVNILVGFEILKELFKHTDEVTYERFLFDTTFQKALGSALVHVSIQFCKQNHSTLVLRYN